MENQSSNEGGVSKTSSGCVKRKFEGENFDGMVEMGKSIVGSKMFKLEVSKTESHEKTLMLGEEVEESANFDPDDKVYQASDATGVVGFSSNSQIQENFFSISQLPSEILRLVFHHISLLERIQVMRVCRRWKNVLLKHGWPNLHTISYDSVVQTGAEDLKFFRRDSISLKHVETLLQLARQNLRELNIGSLLSNLRVSRVRFNHFVCQSFCLVPNVETLVLKSMRTKMGGQALFLIGTSFPKLKRLFLNGSLLTNAENGLRQLFRRCPLLEEVDLSHNWNILGRSFDALPSTLRTLKLVGCEEITNRALLSIGRNCPLLQVLDVDYVYKVAFKNLDSMLRKLTHLTELSISRFDPVVYDDNDKLVVLGELKDLRYLCLDLSPKLVSDDVLYAVSKGCPLLEELNICYTSNNALTERGLQCMVGMLNLRYLRLAGLSDALNGQILTNIARRGKLERLDISDCFSLSNSELIEVLDRCKDNLETLLLCSVPTSANFLLRLKDLPKLTVLELSGNTAITDEILTDIARIGKLESLNVVECENVSDSSILEMTLKHLNVCGCPKVTERVLQAIYSEALRRREIAESSVLGRRKLAHCVKFSYDFAGINDPQVIQTWMDQMQCFAVSTNTVDNSE